MDFKCERLPEQVCFRFSALSFCVLSNEVCASVCCMILCDFMSYYILYIVLVNPHGDRKVNSYENSDNLCTFLYFGAA